MKKYLLLAIIAIYIGLIIPCKVYAADITVGATTWYAEYKEASDFLDPTFMFGPVASVKFNDDFNLTFVYLYGQFKDKFVSGAKMKRQDSDLALNYRLNNYFKLFGGIKYMNCKSSSPGNPTYKSYSYGPALGVSFTYPFIENIFFLATLSGSYLWWNDEDDTGNEYGYNSTLSLAYYIPSASTVLSIGYRYQRFIDTEYSSEKTTFSGLTLTATYSF